MYKQEVQGEGCISAKIVADSTHQLTETRIVTFELEYPRFIHSELMTHRMFSRNAMSSRAVPIERMIEQVRTNPAKPIHWGANQKGMQASGEIEGDKLEIAKGYWDYVARRVASHAGNLDLYGLHKQIVNRILEPFQIMKTVVTATEWENFWWLRDHEDAQPEIRELARCMRQAFEANLFASEELNEEQWHTPYVEHTWTENGDIIYFAGDQVLTEAEALKVSASCCAQVSFRLNDNSVNKAIFIYDKLVESQPVHASPFEHQAQPMTFYNDNGVCGWEEGTTHSDINSDLWSGNFKHWIQHRQLIPNHVKEG